MKKISHAQILAFGLFLITAATPVIYNQSIFAQEDQSSPRSLTESFGQLREKRKELGDLENTRNQGLLEKRREIRERLSTQEAQIRQSIVNRIKVAFGKILRRYKAALERLDKITKRIDARIEKLEAKDVNTDTAQRKFAAARSLGADAKDAIEAAIDKVESIDPSGATIRDAVATARDAVKDAKKALIAYHKSLAEVARELKAAAALREGTEGAR